MPNYRRYGISSSDTDIQIDLVSDSYSYIENLNVGDSGIVILCLKITKGFSKFDRINNKGYTGEELLKASKSFPETANIPFWFFRNDKKIFSRAGGYLVKYSIDEDTDNILIDAHLYTSMVRDRIEEEITCSLNSLIKELKTNDDPVNINGKKMYIYILTADNYYTADLFEWPPIIYSIMGVINKEFDSRLFDSRCHVVFETLDDEDLDDDDEFEWKESKSKKKKKKNKKRKNKKKGSKPMNHQDTLEL
jgi:hypothetical protein